MAHVMKRGSFRCIHVQVQDMKEHSSCHKKFLGAGNELILKNEVKIL